MRKQLPRQPEDSELKGREGPEDEGEREAGKKGRRERSRGESMECKEIQSWGKYTMRGRRETSKRDRKTRGTEINRKKKETW